MAESDLAKTRPAGLLAMALQLWAVLTTNIVAKLQLTVGFVKENDA